METEEAFVILSLLLIQLQQNNCGFESVLPNKFLLLSYKGTHAYDHLKLLEQC